MKSRILSILFFLFSSFFLQGQVTADFSSNVTSGCSPLVVIFSDLSTGNPTSWNWNLGNGNNSNLQNPGATYVTPGTYTVTLTVSNGGFNDTETKTAYITVFANPVADFSGTPNSGCLPLSVSFSDLSTPGTGVINQWFWDFGDGFNSSQQNPTHIYTSPGNFTVSLIVTDVNGCTKSVTKTSFINAFNGPNANFSASSTSSCTTPFSVNFTNSSTGSGGLTYQWILPGGIPASSSSQSPSVTYNSAGSYNVTLIVTDGGGCKDTFIQNNFIKILQADFSGIPLSGCASLTVNFTNSSLGNPTTFQWNFGDAGTSTLQNPSHTYSTPGTYTVSLTIGNGTCTESETKTAYITVGTMSPIGFSASDTVPCQVPSTIFFSDNTSGSVAWQWDFGDGGISSLQNPSHTYSSEGIYDVSLVVTVSNGCKDTLVKTSYIVLQKPDAIFSGDTTKGCVPLTVQFTDGSTSGSPIVGWNWNFGDGTSTSSVPNPSHTFTDTGQYVVKLIITNDKGCVDSTSILIYVGQKPVANFSGTPLSGCRPLTVDFTDLSSNFANMWLWNFGDGATDTTQNPTHIYNDTGAFDVTLIVSNNGCRDTLSFVDYVTVFPPKAIFSVLPGTIGCSVPFTVSMQEESQGADTWFWDFGNGNTFTGQNPPPFTYDSGGQFSIKLVVTNNSSGCSDSSFQTIRISDPVAGFTVTGSGCQPLLATFTDTSSSPFGVRNWQWNFGDGNSVDNLAGQLGTAAIPNGTNNFLTSGTYQNPTHTYMTPGTYSVTLTITDQLVCSDAITLTNIITVNQIPTVNITSDKQTGCPPFSVQFTDLSTGPIGMAEWNWNFGDGGTDTVQNPLYTYTTGGVFTVTLIGTDSNGCISGIVKNNYITVVSPSAGFISNTGSCIGISQLFTDTSAASNPIDSWFWDFGDGATDTLQSPTHTYGTSGVFDVSLVITDTAGCVDTIVKTNYMTVQSVTSNFGANPTTKNCPPLLVQFSDSSTAGIVSWFWQFGNGNTSALQNPSHLYNAPGKFDVTLIVTTSLGCKDTLVKPELIKIDGPNGDLIFLPDSGCPGTNVSFDTANVQNAISYTWDFGDGNIISSAPPVSHQYFQVGVYHPFLTFQDAAGCSFGVQSPDSIQIVNIPVDAGPDITICEGDSGLLQASGGITYSWTPASGLSNTSVSDPIAGPSDTTKYYVLVSDADGCQSTDSVLVKVNHNVPTADFLFTSACKNDSNNFTDLSTIPADSIVSWNWNFNNGEAQSSDTNSAYLFSSPGNFNVVLTVTSNKGCIDSISKQVTVFSLPVANAGNDTAICIGKSTPLQASGGINYSWMSDTSLNDTSIANPLASPVSQNTYFVIVKDVNNCLDTDSVFVLVNLLPVAEAGSGAQICPGDSVILNASGGVIYAWNPDNTLSDTSIATPFASPSDTSEYFVTVTDNNGCENIDSVTIIVNPDYPVADFSVTTVCKNDSTFFSDLTTVIGDTVVSWEWDFGDGGTVSTDTNPTHVFSGSGNFFVSLVITTNTGCTDSIINPVIVYPLPLADAGPNDTICIFQNIQLQASGGVIYSWLNDATLSDTSISNPLANPNSSNSYFVIVKDINNCIDTDSVFILVNPLPLADAGSYPQVCLGDSIMFNASGGISYAWNPENTLSDTSIATPFATPTDTTQYFVSVTDNMGCVNFDSVTIIVNPNYPLADFSATIVCKNISTIFTDNSFMTGDTIKFWDWDFDNGGIVSTDTNPSYIFSTDGNFNVSLTITTNIGCKDSIVKTVVVHPLPLVNAGMNDTICIFQNAQLLASGGNNFDWNPDTTLNDTTIPNPIASPQITNYYVVFVTDTNNCVNSDTVTVIVNPLPVVNASPDTQICIGESIALNANGGEIYSWSPVNTLSNPDTANPTATPVDTTKYIVIVTDSNGCVNNDTVVIVVNPNFPFADFSATIVCETQTTVFIDLSSVSGDTVVAWNWNFGDSNTDTLQNTSNLYSNDGSYLVTLIITTNKNCRDTIIDTVFVNTKPEADFIVTDNCFGVTTNFKDTTQPKDIIANWLWDFGDNTGNLFIPDPPHNYLMADTFNVTLIVQSDSGCSDTVVKPVQVFPKPEPDFSATIVCLNEATLFTDLSTVDASVQITSRAWYFGEGQSVSTEINPAHIYESDGTFTVKLVVATGGVASCADSITKQVIVNPLPESNCEANPLETNTRAPEIKFSTGIASTYLWEFAGLDTSSQNSPSFSFPDSGTYSVILTTTNNFGCTDTCQVEIRINPYYDLEVPNAFTPNPTGPNGGDYSINPFNNDVFFPVTKYLVGYKMMIYNRWGELLFVSEDLKIGWDGYYKGKLCQQDVYVWKIKATFADGNKITKAGDVTLIR